MNILELSENIWKSLNFGKDGFNVIVKISKKKIAKNNFVLSSNDNFIPSSFFLPLLTALDNKYAIYNLNEDFNTDNENQDEFYIKKLKFPLTQKCPNDEILTKAYLDDNVSSNGISFNSYKDLHIIEEYYKVFVLDKDFIIPKGLNNKKELLVLFTKNSILTFEIFPDGSKSILCTTYDNTLENFIDEYVKNYNKNIK
ncbi:MAG: hypothetical protein WCR30_04360 [Clostridia bacterium]